MAATVRMSAVRPSEGTFNASRVPRSLQPKQIIVTGGTSGIGLEATKVGDDDELHVCDPWMPSSNTSSRQQQVEPCCADAG